MTKTMHDKVFSVDAETEALVNSLANRLCLRQNQVLKLSLVTLLAQLKQSIKDEGVYKS